MPFFDYDMLVGRDGKETYVLRANTKGLQPHGSYCRVYLDGRLWCRKTRWSGLNGSIRYYHFDTLDEALLSGIRWAARRYHNEGLLVAKTINQVCREGGLQ